MNIPFWVGEHVYASFRDELEKISFMLKQDLPNVGTAPAMISGPAIGSDPTAKPKIPSAMKIPKPKGLKMPSMSGGMKMPRSRSGKM
jgi:hypothetical protein